MNGPESDFQLSESALLRQEELADRAADLARQLADLIASLRRCAPPDLSAGYCSAADQAERLNCYCSGLSRAMSDTRLDMRALCERIGVLLDETFYDLQFLIHQHSGE